MQEWNNELYLFKFLALHPAELPVAPVTVLCQGVINIL